MIWGEKTLFAETSISTCNFFLRPKSKCKTFFICLEPQGCFRRLVGFPPKSSILIEISMIFTIHFEAPLLATCQLVCSSPARKESSLVGSSSKWIEGEEMRWRLSAPLPSSASHSPNTAIHPHQKTTENPSSIQHPPLNNSGYCIYFFEESRCRLLPQESN